MKVPGSIYIGKEGRKYLALYNFFPDIYRAAPPSLYNTKRIAHVAYAARGIRRGIDVFTLKSDANPFNEVDVKRTIHYSEKLRLEQVDKEHDIRYQVVRDAKGSEIEKELFFSTRKDILDFCRNKAKMPTGTRIEYVREIIPNMDPRKIKQKSILRGGKQEFVPSCSLEANLDFSWGCPSGLVNGFLDPWAECGYCYSIYQHKTFSKYLLDFDKKQLKGELLGDCHISNGSDKAFGRPIRVLRLGKRTESASKFTLDSLVLTLETCAETGTRVILPTKYLAFDKEIANLLKKTRSSVLYSIGFDELERGACSHGCNNDFRLGQAKLYREKGVNSMLYLLIDLPHPPGKRERETLKFAEENKIPVQLLPIRITGKDLALRITGVSWESLKRENHKQFVFSDILGKSMEKEGGYSYIGAGMMTAQEKNSFWTQIIENNKGVVRMCHHDEKETYCGRCFLDDNGFIKPTENVKITYKKFRRGNYKWKRKAGKIGEDLFSKI